MKKSEIKVGGHYKARVSGVVTTVRVDAIRQDVPRYLGAGKTKEGTRYDVTNLSTHRKTTFRSAMKFLSEVKPVEKLAEARADLREFRQGVEAEVKAIPAPLRNLGASLEAKMAPCSNAAPHMIVVARAGTGKTTTLIEGVADMKGLRTDIVPSPQQRAVWDQLALSRDARTVCFTCFNKPIQEVLTDKLVKRGLDKLGCVAMTMHGLGFRAVTKAFGRQEPKDGVVGRILESITGKSIFDLRKESSTLVGGVDRLVSLCKMNLVGRVEDGEYVVDREELDRLASHYDLDLNGARDKVYELTPKVLTECLRPKGLITFDDMIWLPVIHDLPVQRHDLLLVDEAQDLNLCQQALARKAGHRLVLVGDPKQAIYGFAGADSESMDRMFRGLEGCVKLPLTVTRRCGKAIVEEARKIVPDFEAHESNGPGEIRTLSHSDKRPDHYAKAVADGDMILCRVNAPLVSECFRFIRSGRKATIQGRDVGQGLVSLIERQRATSVSDLVTKLEAYFDAEVKKEQSKKFPSEARLIAIGDKQDCIMCFCEGQVYVNDVIRRINDVFTADPKVSGIKLSSIHKAKGLEADRVFLINNESAPCPHPMAKTAWQREQEMNLLYVAITRAKAILTYVV